MPTILKWPPVTALGWTSSQTRPGRVSYSQRGTPYFSQAQRSRRTYDVTVGSIGADQADAGYIRLLAVELDGKMPLVRVTTCPALWWSVTANRTFDGVTGAQQMAWATGGEPMGWGSGGLAMTWTVGTTFEATVSFAGGFYFAVVNGLPPNTTVVYPGELVRALTGEEARVTRPALTDATGRAEIKLNKSIPSGPLAIGAPEVIDMTILGDEWPALAIQSGHTTTTIRMREFFTTDTDEPLTEVDPW